MIEIEAWQVSILGFVFAGVISMLIAIMWKRYNIIETEVRNHTKEIPKRATHEDMIKTVDRLQSRLDHIEQLILDLNNK